MTFLPWSDSYSLQIRSIDNDHKELFDAVNELHTALAQRRPEQEVDFTIGLLERYVKEHFAREEQLMADYGYPWLSEHKAQHQTLTHMVQAIRKIQVDRPDQIDADKLLNFLKDWLVKHILGSDMTYAQYLHGGGGQGQQHGEAAGKGQTGNGRLVTVQVEVPDGEVDRIRHIAQVLCQGGEEVEAIEGFADSLGDMSYEDALKVAASLLR